MAGVLQLPWSEVLCLSLRELFIHYDSYLLNSWDHTALLAAQLHNLTASVVNIASKRKVRGASFYAYHPFRREQRRGFRITAENIRDLRFIVGGMSR